MKMKKKILSQFDFRLINALHMNITGNIENERVKTNILIKCSI